MLQGLFAGFTPGAETFVNNYRSADVRPYGWFHYVCPLLPLQLHQTVERLVEIDCSSCSARLDVPSHLLGKAVRCPKCQQVCKTVAPQRVQAIASTSKKGQPAAPTSQQAQGPSKKVTISCPSCGKRLQFAKTASTKSIKCPSCQKVLKLKSSQSAAAPVQKSNPVVVQAKPISAPAAKPVETLVEPIQEPLAVPVTSQPLVQPVDAPLGDPLGTSPSSSGGDVDLFGGLPTDLNAAGPASNPYVTPQQFSPAAYPSSPGTARYGNGAFIPGLLLTIQAAVGILICFAAVVMFFSRRLPIASVAAIILLGPSLLGLVYQGTILGGAIQMMRGRALLYGRIVSIMAVVPLTALSFGVLSALLFYPIALTGGIWGICVLFSGSISQGSSPASPRQSPANNPYQALGQASAGSSGSDERSGTGMAILYIAGGVGCWILAIGLGIVVFSNLGDARRPGKAIAGVVFLAISGFSLLATGASQMRTEG